MNDTKRNKGFITHGEYNNLSDDIHANYIVANRDGLLFLKEKIEEVLSSDEPSKLDDKNIACDFDGLLLRQVLPIEEDVASSIPTALVFGFFVAGAILLAIFTLGLYKLFEMVMNLLVH